MQHTSSLAFNEVIQGFKWWRVWLLLGWQDIRLRYRRSVLGPWWITISMLVTIIMLGFLYGKLFKLPMGEFLPYLAIGMVTWNFILNLINEGTSGFVDSAPYLKQISMPYSVFVLRLLVRNSLIFMHNVIPVILVMLIFQVPISPTLVLLPLSFFIIVLNGFCYAWILGILGARFRDLQPIITSLMQIVFFLTPIIWVPRILPERYLYLVNFNPFAQFLDLFRQPLLGQWPSMECWLMVSAVSIIGILVMFWLVNKTRKRIIFWL